MQKIPEELKKQGVRWVNNEMGDNRLLFKELEENTEYKYLIVSYGDEDRFLKGREFAFCSVSKIKTIPQPQETKKIPYTAETFPDNAIWIRRKHYSKGVREAILDVYKDRIEFEDTNAYFEDTPEDIEIGCQVIKGGEIKIEWKPFYQIKE